MTNMQIASKLIDLFAKSNTLKQMDLHLSIDTLELCWAAGILSIQWKLRAVFVMI